MKYKLLTIFHKALINICKIIIFFCLGIIFVLIIGLASAYLWSPYISVFAIDQSKQVLNMVGYINRAQIAYFSVNTKFSDNLYDLYESNNRDKELQEQFNTYDYHLEAEKKLAFIYAIPKNQYDTRKILGIELRENKNKPFYGYVGAVFMASENNSKIDTIICQNKTIGIITPNKPILTENTLSCGEETREVK